MDADELLRIFFVDDNPDIADASGRLLSMQGHHVRTAYSGTEALEIAGQFVPNVALLDIGMPKLNGYELARRIRSEPWGQEMLLVAVTGWGQADDQRMAREAGFDHHLVKPVDPNRLERMLTTWVSARLSSRPWPEKALDTLRPSRTTPSGAV